MATATRTVTTAGTSLANDASVSAPDVQRPAADVWRGRRNLYFIEEAKSVSRWALVAGGMVHIGLIAILVHAHYPTWRILSIGGLYLVFGVVQRFIIRRSLNENCVEASFVGMNVAAQLFVTVSATLTGGLHSPLLPSLLLPSIVSLLFFGPIAASRWIALCNGLLVVAMLALPASYVGPALPDSHYMAAILLGLGWSIFMLHMMAGKLANAAARAGDSYECLREERVSEAEAQLRRLQSVGAKVAHELKNPLASIKGLCQLVARAPDSERTQERLAVVASEISRMETILNEYLSFSRPLEDLNPEPMDIAALGRDVLDVLAGRADQAGVTLTIDGPSAPVHGDPRRLKEALMNLVANAIEATPNGGTVHLRIRPSANSGVTLEVKDTGRGIAAEDLERLGTSFFTTRPNGTGLGVVLAQGVIAQHGGSLSYSSTPGKGTTATVTLPGKTTAPESTSPEPAPRAAMVEARA
ncbi:MAG TPA: HAMP domain-containing sensor histidine kinase [Kofleriaceae bacterium]|nr:HAMP domain-containing sensor histidine kinase [Kofleriaceae bacterium]